MRTRVLAALLAGALLVPAVATAQGADGDGTGVSLLPEPLTWPERADLVMDHTSLAPAIREEGYRWEGNAEIYVAEIVPGVGQPAMVMHDAVQGAFSQNFWPASSVKLLAAVAALEYVGDLGFSGDATVTGSWVGPRTVRSIYEQALIYGDNHSYDLIVKMAGIDFVNREFLPENGLDSATIGTAFTKLSVQVSGAYSLAERKPVGDVPISLPPYITTFMHEEDVPYRIGGNYRSNNIDLFDLGEVVRRVMLHDEIPEPQQFDLDPRDVEGLQSALCQTIRSHYREGAKAEWGESVEVCGKSGWWERTAEEGEEAEEGEDPPPACTDVALVTDPVSGRRVLIAATGTCYRTGIASLAGPVLRALDGLSGTPLQMDAGHPVDVSLSIDGDALVVDLETEAFGSLVQVDGGSPVPAGRYEGGFRAVLPLPGDGIHVLVVTGLDFGVRTAYRAIDFEVGG